MKKKKLIRFGIAFFCILFAGIFYCIFFSKEKEEPLLFSLGEENEERMEDVSFSASNQEELDKNEENRDLQSHRVTKENETNRLENDKPQEEKRIYVHVCGEVEKEGVYELPNGSRVFDAIRAAGGLNDRAAGELVNQARVLVDGERIYVPDKEARKETSQTELLTQTGAFATSQKATTVNINTAGLEELMTLPGIGESRAKTILAYRKEHGEFKQIEDIMLISGIKDAAFEKIKDSICVKE